MNSTATNRHYAHQLNRDPEWLAEFGKHYFGTSSSGKVHQPDFVGWLPGKRVGEFRARAACNPRVRLDNIQHVVFGQAVEGDICRRCFQDAYGWEVK